MTIPEIEESLRNAHDCINVQEKRIDDLERNIEQLREQIGVPPRPEVVAGSSPLNCADAPRGLTNRRY